MIHELKTWPQYFEEVWSGAKTFELRVNDRDYKVGDVLRLQEWDRVTSRYSGREIHATVTYIAGVGPWLTPGHVALAIMPFRRKESPHAQ